MTNQTLIICKSCGSKVHQTPNRACSHCGAPNYGYLPASTEKKTAPVAMRTTSSSAVSTKIVCKNCNAQVERTADNRCSNCHILGWGYGTQHKPKENLTNSFGGSSNNTKKPFFKNTRALVTTAVILLVLVAGGILASKMFMKVDVYEKYHNSVVMLRSEYTFKLSLNGKDVYFTYDEEGGKIADITLNREEAKSMGLYGTGFFIDKEGTIITNRHVVHNFSEEAKARCKELLRDNFQIGIDQLDSIKNNAAFQVNLYSSAYLKDQDADYLEKIKEFRQVEADATKKRSLFESYRNGLSEAKFNVETLFLGYATDGTTVNDRSDYHSCTLVKYSDDPDLDLAVIQANDHKLPVGVTEFINIDDFSTPKVHDEVILLGYNKGKEISHTTTGLNVQQTQGSISQKPDQIQALYSIPTLPGSSGSPVFSSNGKLVAVHYAGVRMTQSFNYGILANHIRKLLDSKGRVQ